MKTKLIRVFKCLLFIVLALLMVKYLTLLHTPKWLENRWQSAKTNNSFYELEENSLDVVFVGSSVIAAAVDPYQLYNDYGISSYNLGVMQQPMMGTYFWLEETLKTQSPSVVVVEIKTAGRVSDKNEADARKSYDYMAWSMNKVKYAIEYCKTNEEASLMEYLFPLSKYHSRWSQLTASDYDFVLGNDNSYTRGFATLTTKVKEDLKPIDVNVEGADEFNEINEDYLKRIINLCKDNNIEIILTKTPDTSWEGKQYNHVKSIAQKYEIDYVDFNTEEMIKATAMDYANDGADSVHLNLNGAKKVTKYFGEYLTKNFEISDKRKDERISKLFNAEMDMYTQTYNDAYLCMLYNTDLYFDALDKEYYSFVLVNGENPSKLNEDIVNKLLKIGISQDTISKLTTQDCNVIEIINGSENLSQSEMTTEEINSVSLDGTFNDGAVYKVKSKYGSCDIQVEKQEYTADDDKINLLVYNNVTHQVADCVRFDVLEDGTVTLGR